MVSWNVTMLSVHLSVLVGAVFLFRQAPCWLQKVVVGLLIAAFSIASFAFALALNGYEHARWPVFLLALVIEHFAVMLWILRVIYRGHLQWKPSSEISLNFSPSSRS